jgi:hypothetical protein
MVDSIFKKIGSVVATAVANEASARQAADNSLSADIASANTSRTTAITTLSNTVNALDTAYKAADALKANLAGSVLQDFNAKSLTVASTILPSGANIDIGSVTQRFKTIFVDEAKLSTNTLYIGDTAILGTTATTINIHSDSNQSIDMKTSGTGTTTVESEKSVNISTSGINADVFLNAVGTGSNVRIGATNEVQVSAPTVFSSTISGTSQQLSGNLTIGGNLTVNGTQTSVNSTIVNVKDNIIVVNSGEIGSGVTLGKAGIQVDRGDMSDFALLFDELDDFFKVGQIGGTFETIATREFTNLTYSKTNHNHALGSLNDVLISNKQVNDIIKWNGTNFVNGVLDKSAIGLTNVDNTADLSKPVSTAQAAAIAVETSARQAAITTLTNNLASEVSTRASAVTTLQTNIDGKLGLTATAAAATKLATARTISLTGDVTGSVSFDGTGNASISTTVSGTVVGGSGSLVGQAFYGSGHGTYTWRCPPGVTSVSVVCIGGGAGGGSQWSYGGGAGGALSWGNNIPVTPGTDYTVQVGKGGDGNGGDLSGGQSYFINTSTLYANGGSNGSNAGGGGAYRGGGGNGGYGSGQWACSGGGAGGYTGNGGSGENGANHNGSGGGAAGGYMYSSTYGTGAGGGVGPFGQGTSGSSRAHSGGMCGSGGTDGDIGENPWWSIGVFGTKVGGLYGGGGGGTGSSSPMGYGLNKGGRGCVRIIWGSGRSFPSTGTGDM